MSNIKRVSIAGFLPFNYYESPELCAMIGAAVAPALGLTLTFDKHATMEPNANGGRTAINAFTLTGDEAISTAWFDRFVALVNAVAHGRVTAYVLRDIEADETLRDGAALPFVQKR